MKRKLHCRILSNGVVQHSHQDSSQQFAVITVIEVDTLWAKMDVCGVSNCKDPAESQLSAQQLYSPEHLQLVDWTLFILQQWCF